MKILKHFSLCREELTYEILSLEPRASDDETLESEASIGTGDSSENLNIDSEGAVSDFSGTFQCYLGLSECHCSHVVKNNIVYGFKG